LYKKRKIVSESWWGYMYHVLKDKRAVKSAQLIWKGLEKCLQEKTIATVRVSDINEKSYVSRATFYRLFDSVQDVIVYECDCIFTEITMELDKGSFSSSKELFLFFIRQWLRQKTLLKALVENNLTNILYETHLKNKELVKAIYVREKNMSEQEADYLVSVLTGIIPSVINVWYLHGQRESADEIFQRVCSSISIINAALNT